MVFIFSLPGIYAQHVECFISNRYATDCFVLTLNGQTIPVLVDSADYPGVRYALQSLKNDFEKVTGNQPSFVCKLASVSAKNIVIIGSLNKSKHVKLLIESGKINGDDLKGKHEKFIIQNVKNPFDSVDEALVIAGSDMRGTIYGMYELSEQMGVSPWYYWADVPAEKQTDLYVKRGIYTAGEPAVKYRGIFINDEAPALAGWARVTFGGFNHEFYEKVFELILRLRGNLLWPAMWGSAFYDDDPENGPLADEMGVVIGTSHHEPMGRAHDEWRRYGTGEWDYSKNAEVLRKFWQTGFERMKNYDKIVTLAMRGDGDEPMSEKANISLLEKIVKDQREIIKNVSGKKITEIPQVWALYKEVQDYYDKGMRVPDDVTLLLCDDNWGNVRKLPDLNARPRTGGYGMYYHFDYVGGPRNYKWLNVSQVQRVWEQMNLTYSHGVDRMWIVNVGDIKPMEYPVSFFLDMAWNPDQFNAQNLLQHTEKWCARQFGAQYAEESARIINLYTKYNRRVTLELLDDKTYSLQNYDEFETVTDDYRTLAIDAFRLYQQIPDKAKDAFDQLVMFPVNACANLYEMYYALAKNKKLAAEDDPQANYWADRVKKHFEQDSLLTLHYNTKISGGKWMHMMDQIRIGYSIWQQPESSIMPQVTYVDDKNKFAFFQGKEALVSIEAEHFNRKCESTDIHWEIIPGFGKTLSGITTMPANLYPSDIDNVALEYDFKLDVDVREITVHVLVAPTLNFNANKGLRYVISIDGGEEQIVNINQTYDVRKMEHWQANSINDTQTTHDLGPGDTHTLKIKVLEPGIVIEKILIDAGGLKPGFLGPAESMRRR